MRHPIGDLLRQLFEHPEAEIVGICDQQPERIAHAIHEFAIPRERVFTDYRQCLEAARPDIVILCPATAQDGEWVEQVALTRSSESRSGPPPATAAWQRRSRLRDRF